MRSSWIAEPARLAARVAVGSAVYAAIVALATPLPAAAGLMLTFPALNGLAFFHSPDERAASIAKSMLWMPVVNGALCAGYVLSFMLLARSGTATMIAWSLVGIVGAVWVACVSRRRVREGIAGERQLAYALAVTLAGALLVAVAALATTRPELAQAAAPTPATDGANWVAAAIWRSRLKIGLFALALAIFFGAIAYLPISDSTRGILSGLPIVPFGGLVAVAGDAGMSLEQRLQIFHGMIGSVWLAPSLAVWFIYCLSRFLGARTKLDSATADAAVRAAALVSGWVLTFAAAVALAYGLKMLTI
jgi:hypothetical protein